MGLWNVGILPQHYTASQPRRPRLWNITDMKASPWRWMQHGTSKRWYRTTTLHGVTTQKTSACIEEIDAHIHFIWMTVAFEPATVSSTMTTVYEVNTDLLTPCKIPFLEKLIAAQLVKKLSAFYGTRRFITVVYKSPPLAPILSHMNSVHTSQYYFPEIYSSIILSSMPRSSK
jgi:hypothetical protein